MKNNPAAFLTNLEFAEEFFTRCGLLKEDTPKTRTALWQQMVQELKAVRMTDTDLVRYTKGKKILRIKNDR
jgi:hypothetical protein